MEVPSIRGHMGTEKYQMLELNKRLETYLGRVKFLEEENKLLHGEVEALRQSKNQRAWKGQLEAELRKTREEVEAALREKDRVELEVSNLNEELQMLELQRKKVAVARTETKKTVDESKKQLEEEHRAQIWLREKLVQLEKELQFHMEVHQEDVSLLQTKLIHTQYVPPHAYVQPQLLGLEDIKQEFSQRASRAWQEAAGSFQNQVQRLEDSLTQAKSRMAQVSQEKKESYLMAQCLAKELEAAQARKELLEKNVSQQNDRQLKELQHLEAYLETLGREKVELSDQTAAILKDRHNLLQMKMSLGLEVATYRALLDSENLRPNVSPKIYYQSTGTFREVPKHQTIKRSLTPSMSVKPARGSEVTTPTMAPASLQAPKVTPKEKSIRSEMTNNEHDGWCAESPGSPGWSTHYSKADVIDSSLSGDVGAVEADEGEDHAYALSEQMAQELRATVISLDTSVTETSAIRETHIKETEEECHLQIAGLEKNLTKQPPLEEEELDQDSKNTLKGLTVTSQFTADIEGLLSAEQTLDVSEKENPDALKADQLEDNFSDRPVEEISEMTEKHLPVEAVREPLLVWGERHVGLKEVNRMESMTSGSKSEPESERELELETIPNETESIGYEALARNKSNSAEFMLDEKTTEESQSSTTEVKVMQFSEEISLDHRQTTITSDEESKDNVGSMADQQVDELTLEECMNGEPKGYVCKLKEENTEDVAEQMCDNDETDKEKIDEVMELGEENQSFNTSTLISECPRVEKTNEQQVHIFANEEQQELSDNDDFSNATNSWRTGGDLDSTDSYVLENTLADTRPLIRYRSDETDVNTQASHLGETDSSGDEEQEAGAGIFEKEKRYSLGSRGDRMIEDLIEEPEWEEIQKSENAGCFNNRETDASQAEEDDGLRIDKIEEKDIHFEGDVGCLESDGKSVLEIDRKALLSEENTELGQAEQDSALGNKAYDQTNLNEDMGDHVDGIVSTGSTDTKADLEKNCDDKATPLSNMEIDSNVLQQEADSIDIKANLEKENEDEIITQINIEEDSNFLLQEADSVDIKADLGKDHEDDPTTQINLEMDSNFLQQEADSVDIKADLEKDNEDDPTTQINLEIDNNFLQQEADSVDIKADLEKDSEDDPTTQINLEMDSIFLQQEADSVDIKADLEKDNEDEITPQINMEEDSNFLPQQGTIECDRETNLVNPANINSEESSGNLSDNEEGIRKESFVENFTILSYGQSPSIENENTSEILHSQNVTSDEESENVLKSEETEKPPEKKEEDGENSSMLTNVDFTDDLSLHSEITSIAEVLEHTAISDLEDSYSSEDDSPNASQSLKSINQEEISENHRREKERETMACSVNDSGLIGETEKHFPKLSSTSLKNAWGSSDHFRDEEWGIIGTDLKAPDQFIQSDENIKEYFSYTEQKYEDRESKASEQQNGDHHNSKRKEDDIFTAEVEGLPPILEKCTELFSTTLKEEFWKSNGKMGASFDPQECGNLECVNTRPNPNAENIENMPETKQCTELRLKGTQSHGLPEQEQIPAHIKQLLYKNMEEDKKHSEESLEEEDSWSGGED